MSVYAIETDRNLFGSTANVPDPIGSDGIVPRKFWVSPNGTNGDANGRPDAPFLTVTFALSKCVDGRGDTIYVGPGSYAERVSVDKQNVAIIGTGGRHTGLTQIIGPTTGTAATFLVPSGYLRGFKLANIELDTNGVSRPALHLVTDDTGSGSQTNTDLRGMVENVAVRSDDPSVGLLLEGTTMCDFANLRIQGPTIGIGISGSLNNNPTDLTFNGVDFLDCVTADIASVTAASPSVVAPTSMTNVIFRNIRHWDRGGTPVTNYVNFTGGTYINTHFFDCWAARDVADGTLVQLPPDVVWIGRSAAAAEFIIGA